MSRLQDMPLQRKIGFIVLVGLFLFLGIFALLGAMLAEDHAQRTVSERLVMAQLTASFLDVEIEEVFEYLQRVATHAAADPTNGVHPERFVKDPLHQPEPFVVSVFLADNAGQIVWAHADRLDGTDVARLEHSIARDIASTRGRYVSGVMTVGSNWRPLILLAVPVRRTSGELIGTLTAVVDASHPTFMRPVSAAQHIGQTGHAELIDQAGRVIVSSEVGRVLGPGEHPDFYRPLLERRVTGAGTTPPIGDEDPAERGHRHVMAFVPLSATPWGLLIGDSEDEFWALANRWRWQTAVSGGLSLLIALFLVWVTTRAVAVPVQALTVASRRIAGGDLETPVATGGEGEVRELAQAFDDMRSHLRQALKALAVEKSRHEGIVGSMADAVFTTDTQRRITAFNPAAEALTGWHAELVIGRSCSEVIRARDEQGQEACSRTCPLLLTSSATRPAATKETLRTRDAREVVVATSRSAIHDNNGVLAGVVHVLRDISAEEEVNRLKDEFLSTVSHELRTPLGYIKGYAGTLLVPAGAPDEETSRRCLRVIIEASDELEELVDNLLDMSKISAGVLGVDAQVVRLERLARAAVERARTRARGRRLRVMVPPRLPLVLADPHRIEQVLYNLLDNAIKYSPEGGRIVISAAPAGTEVLVSIADEGLGIPTEELGELFQRFHRGKTARERHIGGSGLGLAISKGIVEAHGGRIWAESPAPSRPEGASPGSVLHFTLPIAASVSRPRTTTRKRRGSGGGDPAMSGPLGAVQR